MVENLPFSDGVAGSHKAMVRILSSLHGGLNIFHFNARSLNGHKLDYVKFIFDSEKVDILCVSETWFDVETPDSAYAIEGFTLFRSDRVGRRGGGVAIYCKNYLNTRFVSRGDGSTVEYINVEISCSVKILVSCVYNPYRLNSLDPFFVALADRLLDFDYFVACGDFNVDLLNCDNYSSALKDHLVTNGLLLVNSSIPTRYSNNSTPSLLDIFLVSDMSLIVKFDQMSFVSDHDLIFCSLNISTERTLTYKQVMYRDYRSINLETLFADLSNVVWSDCWQFVTADEKLDWLMSVVKNSFDRHVPLRSVRIRSNSVPWFTAEVLAAIKQRNILHATWRRCRIHDNWVRYTYARNKTNSIIKRAKTEYFSKLLNTSVPTKQLWNNIRKLNEIGRDNLPCPFDANDLNHHFAITSNATPSPLFASSYYPVENTFEFTAVSEGEVANHIASIKSDAVGFDRLPLRFVKIILPFILSSLTDIINHCFTTSVFPNMWKVATITPIAKKSDARSLNDYRPISILPALANVMERIMSDQISTYLSGMKLLSPLQSGFRVGHSCTTAMLKILDDIRVPFDRNQLTLLCLLDFSKAFDSVNHKLLIDKLEYYFHFNRRLSSLLANYLQYRQQRVCVRGTYSSFTEVKFGVPQGSTLGPLLFSMFINDLLSLCKFVTMHAYADDIQMYISDDLSNVGELAAKLNTDLKMISTWALENGLLINIDKSVVLPISYKVINFCDILPIIVGTSALKLVSTVRNLGFVLNSKLTCSDHVNSVISKIFLVLRALRRTSIYTPVDIKRYLVLQLIMPYIHYFCTVFSKLDSLSSGKLNVAFNSATRYVYSLRRFDHVSLHKKGILGVELPQYLEMRNVLYLHSVMSSEGPNYLKDKLIMVRSPRTRHLLIPRFKHLSSSRMFFVNAARAWNNLPVTLRTISNSGAFRDAILKHYSLSNPFPS